MGRVLLSLLDTGYTYMGKEITIESMFPSN